MAKKKAKAKPAAADQEAPEQKPRNVNLWALPQRLRMQWEWLPTVARTVWGEARNQGFDGMLAVACVIANRSLASTWYGSTPEDVCTKRWQFSCWNEGDPNRQRMLSHLPGDSETMSLAIDAVLLASRIAGTDHDPTNGATHFHTHYVNPDWSQGKKPCATIGDHVFFNNVD